MTFKQGDRLYHLITSFKDQGITLFVFKHYSKRRQRWMYEVIEDYIIENVYDIPICKLKETLEQHKEELKQREV